MTCYLTNETPRPNGRGFTGESNTVIFALPIEVLRAFEAVKEGLKK